MTNVEFTSDVVRSATFREKLKGYNPEDVHAFMERSAAAIDQLTARLGEASARALKAEAALASNSEADESVRRTLVLAQRTAEMAVREANDEAAAIRFEARRESDQLLHEARTEASQVQAEAGSQAETMTRDAERIHAEADEHATATVADADTYTTRVRNDANARAATTIADADARAATTIADADARAATTIADAEAHATTRVADAEARAAGIDAAVEAELAPRRAEVLAEIERASAAARDETEEAISALRAQHSRLWADVEALSGYLDTERARVIETLQGSLDRFGEMLSPAPLPDVAPPEPTMGLAAAAVNEVANAEAAADQQRSADTLSGPDGHDDTAHYWHGEPGAAVEGHANGADDGHDERADADGAAATHHVDELHEADDGDPGEGGALAAEQSGSGDVYQWTPASPGWSAEPAYSDTEAQGGYGETDSWEQSGQEDAGWHDDGAWSDASQPAPQWGQAPGSPTGWVAAPSRPEAGWADAAAYRADSGWSDGAWPQPHHPETEPAWGQPIESGYRPGSVPADVATEPTWEWPGRTDVQTDPEPATAWFGGQVGSEPSEPPAWSADGWGSSDTAGHETDERDWGTSPDASAESAVWPTPDPTTWTGWAEGAADPADPRDPWEGIEPVESTWAEPSTGAEPAVEQPPSRLMFTLGDEARTGVSGSRGADADQAPKPRKTLLGRLKG